VPANGGVYRKFNNAGNQVAGGFTVPAQAPAVGGAAKSDSGVDAGANTKSGKANDAFYFVSDLKQNGFYSLTETDLNGQGITKSLLATAGANSFPNGLAMEDIAVIDSLTGGITPPSPNTTPEPQAAATIALGLAFGVFRILKSRLRNDV